MLIGDAFQVMHNIQMRLNIPYSSSKKLIVITIAPYSYENHEISRKQDNNVTTLNV